MKRKKNFAENQVHQILRLFDVLPNFTFDTSETMGIMTYKHVIYKLINKLKKDLGLSM